MIFMPGYGKPHQDFDISLVHFLIGFISGENFLLIVCGTIPALKPLWDRYVAGKTSWKGTRMPSYEGGNLSYELHRKRPSAAAYEMTDDMTTRV